jgi:hypothetical protein
VVSVGDSVFLPVCLLYCESVDVDSHIGIKIVLQNVLQNYQLGIVQLDHIIFKIDTVIGFEGK